MSCAGLFVNIKMKLFKYEGYKVTVSEEALLLKPFRAIWDRDKGRKKERALAELGFVYFMEDPRSDYMYIVDEEERAAAVLEGEGLPKSAALDSLVRDARVFYASFKPTAALLLEDTKVAVEKLRALLRDIDLTATDAKGKPIYTLSNVTSTIKQVPVLAKDLDEAEKALASEMRESKARGSGQKTLLDDSLDI